MWKKLAPLVFGGLLGVVGLLCYRPVVADVPGAVFTVPSSSPSSVGVLAVRRDAFLELEDGRAIARVDSRLHRRGDLMTLSVAVDAEGPLVEPLPGLEGVPGANERTAAEIDALLAAGEISACVVLGSGRRLDGRVVPAKPTHLLTRRLDRDGRIDFEARTRAYVAGFTVVVEGLPVGTHRLEVSARGEVRLTGSFRVERDRGSLAGFTATGGLHRLAVGGE